MKEILNRGWPYLAVLAGLYTWLIIVAISGSFLDIGTAYSVALLQYFPLIVFLSGIALGYSHGWDWPVALLLAGVSGGLAIMASPFTSAQTLGDALSRTFGFTLGYLVVLVFGITAGTVARWALNRRK